MPSCLVEKMQRIKNTMSHLKTGTSNTQSKPSTKQDTVITLLIFLQSTSPHHRGTLPYGHLVNTVTSILRPVYFAQQNNHTFSNKKTPFNATTSLIWQMATIWKSQPKYSFKILTTFIRSIMPKLEKGKLPWRSVSFVNLSLGYQTHKKKLKKVNSTSYSLPEKHLESEQLFRNCDCDAFLMSFLKSFMKFNPTPSRLPFTLSGVPVFRVYCNFVYSHRTPTKLYINE